MRRALMETDLAQPAVGAACVAMLGLLRKLGCQADVLAGHSYGEAGGGSCRAGALSLPAAQRSCRKLEVASCEMRGRASPVRWPPSWPDGTTSKTS